MIEWIGPPIRTIITNAFSINMLPSDKPINLQFIPLTLERAREYLQPGYLGTKAQWESAVGHPDTAAIFSGQLGEPIPVNRQTIHMARGIRLLVGQYTGPRLPEGTTILPEGARIEWWLVTVG